MRSKKYERNRKPLTCREVRKMIPGYIEDRLPDRDLTRFLRHIRGCRSCYEELETNFMIRKTVEYLDLDTDASESLNLKPMLRKDIAAKERRLQRKSFLKRVRVMVLLITLILIAFVVLDITDVFHVTRILNLL